MLQIVKYRGSWKTDFEQIKAALLACAPDKVLRIDHIGSTSIPGMSAKDIIDVQVGLSQLSDADSLIKPMQELGYEYVPDFFQDHAPGHEFHESVLGWEKRFFRASGALRPANIHVRVVGAPNYEFALLFRDYLRKNNDAARAYQQVKERLAEALPNDRKSYTLIKDPVCDLIWMLAKQWARSK